MGLPEKEFPNCFKSLVQPTELSTEKAEGGIYFERCSKTTMERKAPDSNGPMGGAKQGEQTFRDGDFIRFPLGT